LDSINNYGIFKRNPSGSTPPPLIHNE